MKKHLPLLFCSLLLLTLASFSMANNNALLAQDNAESQPTQTQTEESSETEPTGRVLRPRDRDSQTEDSTAQAGESDSQEAQIRARERVLTAHAERLQRRFTFYYQRLMRIGDKLRTRLQTMAENGADVQEAQDTLNEAFDALAEAQIQTQAAIQAFEAIDPEQYQAQRQMALSARDTALEAHNQFQEALSLMIQVVQMAAQQTQVQNQQ